LARLVLALGAEAKLDLVPGAAEFALPFSTLEDALVNGLFISTLFFLNFAIGKRSHFRRHSNFSNAASWRP
jgi:NADH:ubiquinone reductase (non-electrogenic)